MYTSDFVTTSVEVELKGCLFEVEVTGVYSCGGSNRYGSDEPEWCDLEIDEVEGLRRVGKFWKRVKLSKRLIDKLLDKYEDEFLNALQNAMEEGW